MRRKIKPWLFAFAGGHEHKNDAATDAAGADVAKSWNGLRGGSRGAEIFANAKEFFLLLIALNADKKQNGSQGAK